MKQLLLLCLIFSSLVTHSQTDSLLKLPVIAVDKMDSTNKKIADTIITKSIVQPVTNKPASNPAIVQPKKPELFNSGFIDFQNSGQMNASARVFKIYIGEPKKFMLPLSVYSGVSGNNYNTNAASAASSKGGEQMVLGLINPMSGVFNFSTDNTFRIGKKNRLNDKVGQVKSLTGVSFVYQLGEKMITAQQAVSYKTFSFFSTYANTGLLFQTGAWEKDKEKNMGVFWLLVRGHVVKTSRSFYHLSGYPPDKGFFKGYSIGMGIEINNVLNIKSYYYRYINPGASIFDIPIFQLTFNYSMR